MGRNHRYWTPSLLFLIPALHSPLISHHRQVQYRITSYIQWHNDQRAILRVEYVPVIHRVHVQSHVSFIPSVMGIPHAYSYILSIRTNDYCLKNLTTPFCSTALYATCVGKQKGVVWFSRYLQWEKEIWSIPDSFYSCIIYIITWMSAFFV